MVLQFFVKKICLGIGVRAVAENHITAAILGGIGSIPEAGGFLLAFFEVWGTIALPFLTNNLLGTQYRDIFLWDCTARVSSEK